MSIVSIKNIPKLRWTYHALLSICLLSTFILAGCGMPKVRAVSDSELSAAMSEINASSADALETRLAALRRTGDILHETTTYHPYIKVANIYVASSLHADGIYTHGQVVSVPLILNARKNSATQRELSSGFKAAVDKNTQRKKASQEAHAKQVTSAVVVATPDRVDTHNTHIQTHSRASDGQLIQTSSTTIQR